MVRTGAHDVAGARDAARDLLDGGKTPTAFVAGNNRSSLAVLQELVRMSPDPAVRPALIGFDDVEWADVLGLTVVAPAPGELGRKAVDLMLGRLRDFDQEPTLVTVPVHVIARGSGERPPLSAPAV